MRADDRYLLCAIAEGEPCTFADISFRSKMATDFLGPRLDDLQTRGFILLHDNQYSLAKGVRDHLTH